MKKVIIVAAALFCCGCDRSYESMSVKQQVEDSNSCKKAGLYPWPRYTEQGVLIRIDCRSQKTEAEVCSDKGGVPILSAWDGKLKNCIFKN